MKIIQKMIKIILTVKIWIWYADNRKVRVGGWKKSEGI